jgi:hypothetical protein
VRKVDGHDEGRLRHPALLITTIVVSRLVYSRPPNTLNRGFAINQPMRAAGAILILLSIFFLFSLAAADMPASFYQAMGSVKTEDTICVKNYDAGASVTESYKDFEHLEKETEVVSRSYNTSNSEKDYTRGNASLEVNINSNIIGKAHIAWQSKDLMPDYMGRHVAYSQAAEDLIGVFDIEKFIQLWSNSTLGTVSVDWLPCS